MVDFGIGAPMTKMRVENAAEAGAQYALANPSTTRVLDHQRGAERDHPDECRGDAERELLLHHRQRDRHAVTCASTCSDGSKPGTYISVSAQVTYHPLLAYPGIHSPMTLTGYSIVRVQ